MDSKKNLNRESNVGSASARIFALLNTVPPKTFDSLSHFAAAWFHKSPVRTGGTKLKEPSTADLAARNSKTSWVAAGVLGGMALWYLGTRHRNERPAPFSPGGSPGRIRDPDPTMRL